MSNIQRIPLTINPPFKIANLTNFSNLSIFKDWLGLIGIFFWAQDWIGIDWKFFKKDWPRFYVKDWTIFDNFCKIGQSFKDCQRFFNLPTGKDWDWDWLEKFLWQKDWIGIDCNFFFGQKIDWDWFFYQRPSLKNTSFCYLFALIVCQTFLSP